jgi:hypothetical protein
MTPASSPSLQPPRAPLRWRAVALWAGPVAGLSLLAAGLYAIDPWLALVPRDIGRVWMERFLRSLLIVYPALLVLIPLLLIVSGWLLVRARRRGLRAPWLARLCLASGSAALSIAALELSAAAWLAWEHRMPVLPRKFADAGAADELSLVVIGGSSALGYPYNPTLSIGQIVAWRIEQVLPGRKVALDIRAGVGLNTEQMHVGLVDLKRRPDLMIIYSAHNEFLSRFEDSRDAGYSEAPDGAFLRSVYDLSLHSPLCVWIYETVRRHRLGGPPPRINRHRLLDAPTFTPSEYLERMTDFRRRLDAIAGYCKQIGAVAVMVIDPANESGFEPNRTVLSRPATPERRAELTERCNHAREAERESPLQSEERYRSLLAEVPEFAEAHFRLARLLERDGKFDEARDHYIKARDLDGFPVRCTTAMAQVYREVAARQGCILIDGPEVLRPLTRRGILDDTVFHDGHHPTFAANVGLSQAVMDELHRAKALGLGTTGTSAPAVDPADCIAHFGVDSGTWVMALIRAATYYGHLGTARFDPSERLARQRRLEQAARRITAGVVTPERAGIPGVGFPPPSSYPDEWWVQNGQEPGPPLASPHAP